MSLGALNAVRGNLYRSNLYIISDAVHMAGYEVDEICSEFVQVYRALLIFAPKTSETRQQKCLFF